LHEAPARSQLIHCSCRSAAMPATITDVLREDDSWRENGDRTQALTRWSPCTRFRSGRRQRALQFSVEPPACAWRRVSYTFTGRERYYAAAIAAGGVERNEMMSEMMRPKRTDRMANAGAAVLIRCLAPRVCFAEPSHAQRGERLLQYVQLFWCGEIHARAPVPAG